ncbi:MAG: flagellar basal body P-ring formation chaperone FlgA [Phenylobacterium sp.]
MRRMIFAILAISVALPVAAFAGTLVELKATPVDSDGVVTLGDLFDGAGPAASARVAAREGPSVVLDASAVQIFARRYGLEWSNPNRLRRIIVRQGVETPSAGLAPTRIERALVYARNLTVGEEIRAEDLVWSRAVAAPSDAVSDAAQAVGMTARRPLKAGAAASFQDVSAPIVIRAGELVTATYQSGGVSLELQVKALTTGAIGQVISLQNLSSRKTFQGVVTGPGRAITGPEIAPGRPLATTRISRR